MSAKAEGGQQIVRFVDQILLKELLLERLAVSTMGDQLEDPLSGKKRVLGARVLEVQAERRYVAVEMKAAKESSRLDANAQRNFGTIAVEVGEGCLTIGAVVADVSEHGP